MDLHLNGSEFQELVILTANYYHLPMIAVRKDYFITLSLAIWEIVNMLIK